MLVQGMKGKHETKIKKAISPEAGGGWGYSEISRDGDD